MTVCQLGSSKGSLMGRCLRTPAAFIILHLLHLFPFALPVLTILMPSIRLPKYEKQGTVPIFLITSACYILRTLELFSKGFLLLPVLIKMYHFLSATVALQHTHASLFISCSSSSGIDVKLMPSMLPAFKPTIFQPVFSNPAL